MNTTVVHSKSSNPYLAAAGGSSDRAGTEREPSSPGAALLRGDQVAAVSAYGAGMESQAMKRQRGDDSLLFSCDNLQPKATPSEKQQAGGTGAGSTREENSGLIDIQAMARQAAGTTAAPQNSILPMFTPAVMAPVLVPVRPSGPPVWLRIFMVGSILALASALAVLAMYLYRSSRPRASVAARSVAAPIASPAGGVASAIPTAPAVPTTTAATPSVAGAGTPAAQPNPAAAPAGTKAVTSTTSRNQANTRRHGASMPAAAAAAPAPKPAEPVAPAPPSQRSKSHKGPGNSDVDLDGLINGTGGSDSGRSARGTTVTTEALPEHLTRNDILAGMRAVQSRVAICYRQYHVPGTALVNLSIAPNGKVESAHVVGAMTSTPSGDCVTKAARAATFARFSGPTMSVQYPFVLR